MYCNGQQPGDIISAGNIHVDSIPHKMHKGPHYWHLKLPRHKSTCTSCTSPFTYNKMTRIITEGNKVRLTSSDVYMIMTLLKHRKDGFALEYVSYRPFDCGNSDYYTAPSRRNGQDIFNGLVTRPVFKHQLLKFWRQSKHKYHKRRNKEVWNALFGKKQPEKTEHNKRPRRFRTAAKLMVKKWDPYTDPGYWTADMGKEPAGLTDYTEINVVVLQRRKVCRIFHLTGICGAPYMKTKIIEELTDFNPGHYEIKLTYQDFDFEIPFDKNKAEYKPADIKPLLDSISHRKFTVLSATVNAFSSVEGSLEANKRLELKRAESIVNAMEKMQLNQIKAQYTASENWKRFYHDTLEHEELIPFARLDKACIKDSLANKSFQATMEPLLAKQRVSKVYIKVRFDIDPENRSAYLLDAFNQHYLNSSDPAVCEKEVDTMECIQNELYQRVRNDKKDSSYAVNMFVPYKKEYARLILNNTWLKYKYGSCTDRNYCDPLHLEALNAASYTEGVLWQSDYNLLAYVVNHWKPGEEPVMDMKAMDKFFRVLDKAKDDDNEDLIDSLKILYHFKLAAHYYPLLDKDNKARQMIAEAMDDIFEFYKPRPLSDSLSLKLGRFFIEFEHLNYAQEILRENALREHPDHEVLALYLKVTYQHIEEYPGLEYMQLLAHAHDILTQDEWCSLFIGPCNISFQVFDYEPMRNLYCRSCHDKPNYARPQRAKDK